MNWPNTTALGPSSVPLQVRTSTSRSVHPYSSFRAHSQVVWPGLVAHLVLTISKLKEKLRVLQSYILSARVRVRKRMFIRIGDSILLTVLFLSMRALLGSSGLLH